MTAHESRSVAQQLADLGYTQPVVKRHGMRVSPIKRTSSLDNTPHRQQVQSEESYYDAFERTLLKHDCWFFHPKTSNYTRRHRGQKGYPDYTVFGVGWVAWVELKATSLATGKDGRLAAEQRTYKDFIERAGQEHIVFTLPRDWHAIDVWLNEKTGKDIWGVWSQGR